LRIQPVTGSQFEVGKRTVKPSSGKIAKKVWIKASKAVVYKALTEPRELIHWFCDRASLDPQEGGELTAYWRGDRSGQKGRAVITRLVPDSALELLWLEEGDTVKEKGSNHTLAYEIRSKSGMTELLMTDRDDAGSEDETMALLDQGWNSVLLELKDYCERRERSAKVRSKPGQEL
jgi:uncharacterized protein YndB with AHSA1/START domain